MGLCWLETLDLRESEVVLSWWLWKVPQQHCRPDNRGKSRRYAAHSVNPLLRFKGPKRAHAVPLLQQNAQQKAAEGSTVCLAHNWMVQSILVKKARWEREAAGHGVPAVRKERGCWYTACFSFLAIMDAGHIQEEFFPT